MPSCTSRATACRPSRRTPTADTGVRYDIGLDDLRPWRIVMLYEPLRIVLDIGGDVDAVSPNIALYRSAFGTTVRPGDEFSRFVRATIPDLPPGAATIEILLRSPMDGSVSESVFTSVMVAR